MAVAELTRNLRRTFINQKTVSLRDISTKLYWNGSAFLSSSCSSSSAVASGAFSFNLVGKKPGALAAGLVHVQAHEKSSAGSHILQSGGSHSRGYASRAHMKYMKRKTAPVDRFGSLDPSQPKLGFEKVEALADADANVKKIFSLEFGTGKDLHKMRKKISQELVREHPDSKDDLAVKIATITEHIRAVAPHVESNKKDSINKIRMLNAIDRRRKMLKYLRKRNYDRFERLLEELNLSWSPPPEYYKRKTRRFLEKRAIVSDARTKRKEALKEFEVRWREARILEIARLKEELGKELDGEERGILQRSREETSV